MSWDGYINSVMESSKSSCDKVCIIGLQGGAPWTSSGHECNLNLEIGEGAAIADAMTKDDYTTFQAKGIIVGGVKYQFLRHDADEGYVLGKKKDQGSITLQKSVGAIIIGHTAEGKNQGDTNTGVGNIINYLKGLNM